MISTVPELELVELPVLDSFISCDIGTHSNTNRPPCPHEAKWRIAYSCCMRASLMCNGHRILFMRRVHSLPNEPTRCHHCQEINFIYDILLETPL